MAFLVVRVRTPPAILAIAADLDRRAAALRAQADALAAHAAALRAADSGDDGAVGNPAGYPPCLNSSTNREGEDGRSEDRPSAEKGAPPPLAAAVSDVDRTILRAIATETRPIGQVDLIGKLDDTVSRRTLGPLLSRLRERGLIDRPGGERKGDAITSAGRAAIGLPTTAH